MRPIVHKARAEIPGGFWSDKMGGAFLEGDPTLTKFTIEGRCEIKELHMNVRLFFTDISLPKRRRIITEAEKEGFLERYRAIVASQIDFDGGEEGEEKSPAELARIKEDEQQALATFIKTEKEKEPEIPR
jgi:hypothetical protein